MTGAVSGAPEIIVDYKWETLTGAVSGAPEFIVDYKWET